MGENVNKIRDILDKQFFLFFWGIVSAYFLTICLSDAVIAPLSHLDMHEITISSVVQNDVKTENGQADIYMIDGSTSYLSKPLEQIYWEAEKSNGCIFIKAEEQGLTADLVYLNGKHENEYIKMRLPSDSNICITFLRGNTCGKVAVSVDGGEPEIQDLHDSETNGPVLEYHPFENRKMLAAELLLKIMIFLCLAALLFWMCYLFNPISQIAQKQDGLATGRETGMDLVRTFAALFVISVHHVLHYGYYQEPLNHFGAYFATFVRWLFFSCVALFFTISGYFLRRRKLSISHYLKLWRVIRAYIIISTITMIVDSRSFHLRWEELFNGIITYQYSGFMSQYVWLYCLIPFLNITWNNLTQRGHQVLIIVSICATSMYPNVKLFIPSLFLQTYPVTFYFIGAYIAEYKTAGNKRVLLTGLLLWLMCMSIGTIKYAAGGVFNWSFLAISGLGYEMFPNVVITILVFLLLYNCNVRWKWLQVLIKQISMLSFEIYMFSGIMDNIIFSIFRKYAEGTFTQQFIWLPVTAVLSLLLSLCASILLDKILKWMGVSVNALWYQRKSYKGVS